MSAEGHSKLQKKNIIKILQWQAGNPEKVRAAHIKYYQKNRTICIERALEWQKKNRSKINKIKGRYRKKKSKNLNSSYIKHLLYVQFRLKSSEIPQELIELKRKQLFLYRELKKAEEVIEC